MKLPPTLRWKHVDNLGGGGQGVVVLVTDGNGEFDGKYALKGLSKGKPEKAYQRFAQEIEAIKKLDHPNIIKIFDHSEPADDFQFYVMEYIEGAQTLKKLMDTGRNPYHKNPEAALDLFSQLCSAIEAWRGARIVHRDLKPDNILITPDKAIKVIDFGICQIEGGQSVTLTDEAVGSRNYTAPECESGESKDAPIMADFYSAGKVLWSAITNKNAFAREAEAFKSKSMEEMFPHEPRLWHLQHIFRFTIRARGSDRFSNGVNAGQFAADVKRLIAGGFMPLAWLQSHLLCPICGWGQLEESRAAQNAISPSGMVVGERTVEYLRCNYCGLCVPLDRSVMNARLKELEGLS